MDSLIISASERLSVTPPVSNVPSLTDVIMAGCAVVAVLVSIVAALIAWMSYQKSRDSANEAKTSNQLALDQLDLAKTAFEHSLRIALAVDVKHAIAKRPPRMAGHHEISGPSGFAIRINVYNVGRSVHVEKATLQLTSSTTLQQTFLDDYDGNPVLIKTDSTGVFYFLMTQESLQIIRDKSPLEICLHLQCLENGTKEYPLSGSDYENLYGWVWDWNTSSKVPNNILSYGCSMTDLSLHDNP